MTASVLPTAGSLLARCRCRARSLSDCLALAAPVADRGHRSRWRTRHPESRLVPSRPYLARDLAVRKIGRHLNPG